MKVFPNWFVEILKPILVNVATAGVLFGLALAFKPVLHQLFSPSKIEEYPLVCFAEPYNGDNKAERRVDFYVINLRDRSYTRADLIAILNVFSPDPDRPPSPDIELKMRASEPGMVAAATADSGFNKNKGTLLAKKVDDRRVAVRIHKIAPRAFMKVTIQYSGVHKLSVNRTAKVLVPFTFTDLQDRCFQT